MPTLQRSTCIDWIAATVPQTADNLDHLSSLACQLTPSEKHEWAPTKPHNGYTMAVRNADGVKVMAGEKRMGTHLIASGTALAALRSKGLESAEFVSSLLSNNARFARIDLALDAINASVNFLANFRAIKRGDAETSARSWLLVQSGEGGWTLYVGSPSSDQFFRMYNKYAEVKRKAAVPQGVDSWIRMELALSDEVARRASHVVDSAGQDQAVRSFIRAFIYLPKDRVWQRALDGPIVDVGLSSRRFTNTESWLLGPVVATLARESIVKPGFLETFRLAVNRERERLLNDNQLSKGK